MTRKILIGTATAGLAALAATGVANAQRGEARGDTTTQMRGMSGTSAMMDMMRNCRAMHGMMQGPAAALKHRDSLGLSEAQVRKLEAMRTRADETRNRSMERMQSLHRELASVAGADRFDEAAARRALTRMGALHTDMGVAMLRARHEAREVLTAEQREKLTRLGGGMMGGMQGMQGMEGMQGMMGMQGMQGMSGMGMMGGDMGGMMQHCPMMQGMKGMKGMQGGMEGMRMQRPDSTPTPRANPA